MALSNSKYNAILRRYEQQQIENRHEQNRRIEKVHREIPVMEELEHEILAQSAAMARQQLLSDGQIPSRMKDKLADLREQKKILLKAAGFPEDYLELHYHCEACLDTGYSGGKKCRCFQQARIETLYAQSNIREILKCENFDAFSFEYFDDRKLIQEVQKTNLEYMKQVLERCRKFAAEFPAKGGSLLFTGGTGVGKTFLSNCIAEALIRKYCSVIYLSSHDLFEVFSQHQYRYETEKSMEGAYQDILECDLLIIDDLGTEVNNTFITSELFYCINERINRKKGTIISTNLELDMVRTVYSDRITSRLMSHYLMIPLYGGDIRIKKRIRRVESLD